ncbi:MAG TPA: GNAT family N-acetyltransferase [Xanthomonadaceae bacterium]|jgi:predicted GNAT family acetyltransferase|nr:GNAT family N-acetyltransferase [Xanthomonadaceae bacterium]
MDIVITDNPARQRLEAVVDGELSVLEYRIDGTTLVIRHTEVPDALAGRGIASALMKHAFESARERGMRVAPRCSYAEVWVRRNPDYADLVHEGD